METEQKRSIHLKKQINAWAPIGSLVIKAICGLCLVSRFHLVYIGELNLEIPEYTMLAIVIVLFLCFMIKNIFVQEGRGILYELLTGILPAEIVLFIYFTQYQFAAAAVILFVFVCCTAFVLVNYKRIELFYNRTGNIPEGLQDDIRENIGSGRKLSMKRIILRRYLVFALAILLAVPSMLVLFFYGTESVMNRGKPMSTAQLEGESLLWENFETIKLFAEQQWQTLDEQERIDALQVVADIETSILGIEPVTVVNKHLTETLEGSYNSEAREVRVDIKKIGETHEAFAQECIDTVIHECRHAYQQDCIDAVDWSDPKTQSGIQYASLRQWRDENLNYIDGSKDKLAYYEQEIEKDAREYEREIGGVYSEYIYLAEYMSRLTVR